MNEKPLEVANLVKVVMHESFPMPEDGEEGQADPNQ